VSVQIRRAIGIAVNGLTGCAKRMKLAIVMPAVLQTEALVTLTREAVSHLKSIHPMVLYVVCNRLHARLPQVLQDDLQSQFQG
jgi:hypothetical protein